MAEIPREWTGNNTHASYPSTLSHMRIDPFYEHNITTVLILFSYIGLIKDTFILHDIYTVDLH